MSDTSVSLRRRIGEAGNLQSVICTSNDQLLGRAGRGGPMCLDSMFHFLSGASR